jgi:predicted amidohydrolase YtcJ
MLRFLVILLPIFSFADTAFLDGTIVTMDPRATTAEAVLVEGDRIVRVGSNADVRSRLSPKGVVVDLRRRTMLPGFYAAHDHFPTSAFIDLFQVDLNSPPIGVRKSIDDIVAALGERAAQTPAGQWIVGRGYDDTLLKEQRHPTRQDLDRASTRHPIWIVHTSGHLGVANSAALSIARVTAATPQPNGGVIRRDESGQPNGVFEETLSLVNRHVPPFTRDQRLEAVRHAGQKYLAKGVTTAVITGADLQRLGDLKEALARGWLPLRVNAYLANRVQMPATLGDATKLGGESGQIRVIGVKILQDGSLQGYTGYLTAPYHVQPEGKQDFRGYPSRSREQLQRLVSQYHRGGYQVAIHGNGDAAIDDILESFAKAQSEFPRNDTRHRIEHCQTPREDQLDRMRELGISPSFFVGHVFYWGDRHRDLFLGPARAARISPLASTHRRAIRFSVHNDTPVTPVDPLMLVWTAVTRETKAGKVLGADQRISVLDALRAITSDAAWQNHDEAARGSIEPGKVADFVIVSENPLTVPAARIRDITIEETIIGGRSVWKR